MPHTPGEWSVFTDKDGVIGAWPGIEAGRLSIVIWGDKEEYCGVRGNTNEEALANARLIAAAPDLLETLKALVDHVDVDLTIRNEWVIPEALVRARAAIAKATS